VASLRSLTGAGYPHSHGPQAYNLESSGLAEAFIGTFKRDYVDGAELQDAETVLAQVDGWFRTTTPWRRTRRSACGARTTIARRYGGRRLTARPRHRRRRIWLGRAIVWEAAIWGPPENRGLSRSVRAVNLSSPPEQNFGEHSTPSKQPERSQS